VLASSFEKGEADPKAFTRDWDINGEKAVISIVKA
jgi:hypothetical protein